MTSIFVRLTTVCTIAGCTDLPDFDDPRAHEAEEAVDSCDDLLVNGDFDDGATVGWSANADNIIFDADTVEQIYAYSGRYFAWLGGELSVTRNLTQELSVPAGATSLRLEGKYSVAAESETGPVEDTFKIELYNSGGMLVSTPLTLSNTTWTIGGGDDFFRWSDLVVNINTEAVAGQRAKLRLVSVNDSLNNTNFLFDSLSLRSTGCP
ncbi:MAG: hypothetical protein H0V17_21715 [Deltaproteobacteria bacterium]|nr:hypothetical protein [Deltaproteobacteria bacterium]